MVSIKRPNEVSDANIDIDEMALEWLYRKKGISAKAFDEKAFQRWHQKPENVRAYKRAIHTKKTMDAISDSASIQAILEEALAGRIGPQVEPKIAPANSPTVTDISSKTMKKKSPLSRSVKMLTAMSGLAAAVTLFALLFLFNGTIYTTNTGEITQITLEDNSQITLDTDSELRVKYSSHTRKIALIKGRAFFKVAKSGDRRFSVTTDKGEVVALGTEFSVRHEESRLTVILTEGEVEVVGSESDVSPPVQLIPGEKWQVDTGEVGIKTTIEDIDSLLGWRTGRLTFHSTKVADIVNEINRYSDTKVRVADQDLADEVIDAVYLIGKTDSFVVALQHILPIETRYDIEGEITLVPRSSNI